MVFIDSDYALKIYDKDTLKYLGHQSVAFGVFHELVHAYHEKTNRILYKSNLKEKYNNKKHPLYRYDNKEEYLTVRDENFVALILDEPVRNYYVLRRSDGEPVFEDVKDLIIRVYGVLESKRLN